ncbi:MAG TPA: hypothetical protein VJ840_09965 [Gemmatimonadaceae bacterium]|nr:hypothetical protein [Gemmatimonadaceae bacterium]
MKIRHNPRRLAVWSAFSFLALCATTTASAQGIVDMVVPHAGPNAETSAYHAKVQEQIGSMLRKWAESLQKKDSVALSSAYTPNARSVVGRAPEGVSPLGVVQQLFGTSLAGAHVDITVEDFDMSGDMAFVSAVLIAPSAPDDPAPVFVQSLFVLRFDDWHERWQIRQQFIDWRER